MKSKASELNSMVERMKVVEAQKDLLIKNDKASILEKLQFELNSAKQQAEFFKRHAEDFEN